MWCAGEIATAIENHVNIVPVMCDDYVFPDDEFLGELSSFWNNEQPNALSVYGINLQMIEEAYLILRDKEGVTPTTWRT